MVKLRISIQNLLYFSLGLLLILPACNSILPTAGTTPEVATPQSTLPTAKNSSIVSTPTTATTAQPSGPWDPGQELFPGEYMLLPEQDLVPVELNKLPPNITPPPCQLGCMGLVSLFPVYWGQAYYTTSIPYEFWPEMGKKYANTPIKAKIKFSLGLATRSDNVVQQQFAGVSNVSPDKATNTAGELGFSVPNKDHNEEPSNGGVMMKGWTNNYQNAPTPYTDQFSVMVDWDTLGKDSENIDWGNYGLQLKGICLDFYFKHNEQFFHRACQPILRQPREGKFQIGLKLPKDITSVWVAVRPYNNDTAAANFSNVYRSEDVYGVWLVNLQDVTPTSMGSIDVTCKSMNCLPAGSVSLDGPNMNKYPLPTFCPGDTFMGSTLDKPLKFMGGIFGNTDLFGQVNLWTDVASLKPTYYIDATSINLETGNASKSSKNYDTFGSYQFTGPIISMNDNNIIRSGANNPITGIQLDRLIKYGFIYEGVDGTIGKIDNKTGQQIWSYKLPTHSVSDSSLGYTMSIDWRFQCSK